MGDPRQIRLTERTLALLKVVERTSSESARGDAIGELAKQGDSDSGRVLIEYYEYTQWRSIKTDILRALGRMNQQRTVEFLVMIASDRDDLALAGEALVALGATGDAMAGEFLLTVLRQQGHPLRREAVVALSQLDEFPCERELAALLSETDPAPALVQFAILASSSRGDVSVWPHVARHLQAGAEGNGAVFNAALLAAGQLAIPDSRDALVALDLRYRFFSNRLRLASLERVQSRLSLSIEDSVSEVLTATEARTELGALRSLRRFSYASGWEAFELFASSSTTATQALARSVLYLPERAEADLAFLAEHFENIPIERAMGLTKVHASVDATFVDRLAARLPTRGVTRLLSKLSAPESVALLDALIGDRKASAEDRVQAVNALVAQAQMAGRDSVTARACGRCATQRVSEVDDGLRYRILRALGQIGYDDASVIDVLERALTDARAHPSAYLALSSLGGQESAWVVLRRIKKLLESTEKRSGEEGSELDAALSSLGRMGKLPGVAALLRLPKIDGVRRSQALLKIMCANAVKGFEDVVLRALHGSDFQTVMLGLAAARLNHDDAIWEKVGELATSPDSCVAGRAVHSLCHGAGVKHHKRLLERLCASADAQSLMLTVLQNLEPAEGADYQPIISYIDERLSKRDGAFRDAEVYAAATGLRDNLVFAAAKPRNSMLPSGPGSAARHIADIDRELGARISGFDRFNEVVKSTLRNAELTHSHPELFDHRVDKSTMVVEYVKSIDLLLQETLGGQLFASRVVSPVQMQSRVVELQLDDESLPAWQWIKALDIGAPFSADSFPSHKMTSMGRAILTGKLWHAPHRIVDGLRAWAILLLVFGRDFSHRGTPVAPLFRVRNARNESICGTAFRLNDLQDIRNEAAHRGTMLRTTEVEQIREQSFAVLTELNALFLGSGPFGTPSLAPPPASR